MYQSLNTWLRLANFMPMAAVVARGNLAVVKEVLVAYLQYLYETGRPYSHGPFTLAAVQYFHRSLWGSLKSAWAALKTWQTAEPGDLRAPMPTLLVWAMMAMALAELSVPLAAMLILSYHCFLRPGRVVVCAEEICGCRATPTGTRPSGSWSSVRQRRPGPPAASSTLWCQTRSSSSWRSGPGRIGRRLAPFSAGSHKTLRSGSRRPWRRSACRRWRSRPEACELEGAPTRT